MRRFKQNFYSKQNLSNLNLPPTSNQEMEGMLQQYYTEQAPIYENLRPVALESFDQVLKNLVCTGRISKSSKAMEVGCGTGRYIHNIVENTGCSGWGIDINSRMLLMANKRHGNKVAYIRADAKRVPVISNSFDTVFLVNSIHQVKEKELFFNECARILKPKGMFFIITPSISDLGEFLIYRACSFLMKIEKMRMPHEGTFLKLAKREGFRLITKSTSKGDGAGVSIEEFLFCIQGRFLSCLASLPDSKLREVVKITGEFAQNNRIDTVGPYKYTFISFEKEF